MGKRLMFPSIEFPDKRFTWWESCYDSPLYSSLNGNRYTLDEHAGQYETYGHDDCQHSHEGGVARDQWVDYLTSLGAYLVEHPNDAEYVASNWPHAENMKQVQLAIGLKYKGEGKRQYFNLEECKVSTSDSKRHDKRWEMVNSYHDGSLKAVYCVLVKEWYGQLQRFSLVSAIMDEINKESHRYWWGDAFELLGYEDDHRCNNMHCAYNIVDYAVQSWRTLEQAKRQLSCQKNNWVRNVLGRKEEESVS